MVGHLNSGVAKAAGPKYEAGGLAVVSPANTAVELTESGWKTYHRICARDDFQGPAGAKFANEDLGVKSVFVVHDKTAYGEGLATEFKKGAEELGMEVLGFEGQENTVTDFTALVNKIVSLKPDAIYFGGMYNQTALLLKQASEKGFDGYFLSGDGSDDPSFIEIAGAANTKKAFITSAAGDATKTEEGKAWTERYKEKFGKNPNTYAVYGYDSALVVLDGLKRAIEANDGKMPSREQVNQAISETKDFKGIFSTVTFDEKGDNDNAAIYIYSYEKGSYPAEYVKAIYKNQ
jgi:branched-chain amino acid transport system substrate-binding protein